MQIQVSGKQMEIGAALPGTVKARIEAALGKLFSGGVGVHVVFRHEGAFFYSDIAAHLDSGAVLKAEGQGDDAYRAFDIALDHLEKQVRRHTRKLKDHHA